MRTPAQSDNAVIHSLRLDNIPLREQNTRWVSHFCFNIHLITRPRPVPKVQGTRYCIISRSPHPSSSPFLSFMSPRLDGLLYQLSVCLHVHGISAPRLCRRPRMKARKRREHSLPSTRSATESEHRLHSRSSTPSAASICRLLLPMTSLGRPQRC